jgi:hypothetical protein
LPVYEFYKVGEDLHWKSGLDFFGPYGLSVIFIPHWNNNEGGEWLDTSRCFMGEERFTRLLALLPSGQTVVGIDEHTALLLDLDAGRGWVIGRGQVTLWKENIVTCYPAGDTFALTELGPFRVPARGDAGLPTRAWQRTLEVFLQTQPPAQPPPLVQQLVEQRQAARAQKDYARADQLREQINTLGWQVEDTLSGPRVTTIHHEEVL